ncbi:MAG: DUF1580 domain-containing protein [Planctomycetes bacterium]|nr:DUF1580 domain-containing protein [Planctomycetota bacterium]
MIGNEELITLNEATKRLPPLDGRRLHVATLHRWARRGVRGIKLEVRALGGRYCTSIEALDRFGKALADLPPQAPKRRFAPTAARTDARRERDLARVDEAAKAEGLEE